MVAPLDVIGEIIQTYNWGYPYNCACIVLTRLVKEFYTHWRLCKMRTVALAFSLLLRGT